MTMQGSMAQNFSQAPLIARRSATSLRLRHLMEEQQRVEIGQRIRELRNASPHTNRSIADHADVGERSVANWIAGETGITYEHAKAVAELFNVDVRWLWDGKEREAAPDVMTALSDNGRSELQAIRQQLDRLEGDLRDLRMIAKEWLAERDAAFARQDEAQQHPQETEQPAAAKPRTGHS